MDEDDAHLVSFLQKSEQLLGPKPDRGMLDCDCDTYKCSCKKQCFCKLQAKGFDGKPVPNPPAPPAGDSKAGGDKPSIPDHEFKCTCSFDGVGGGGAAPGGTMDCDCKVADCACDRQCVCRSQGGTGFRFKEEEAGGADGAGGARLENQGVATADAQLDSQTY